MSSNLTKFLTGIIITLSVVAFVFFIRVLGAGDAELSSDESLQASIVTPFVIFSVFLLYITVGITVLFSIWNLIKHPEKLKMIVINLVILALIYVVAYVFASDTAVLDVQGQVLAGGEAGATSKFISTMINYTVYLGVIAIGAVGYDAVKSAVK